MLDRKADIEVESKEGKKIYAAHNLCCETCQAVVGETQAPTEMSDEQIAEFKTQQEAGIIVYCETHQPA